MNVIQETYRGLGTLSINKDQRYDHEREERPANDVDLASNMLLDRSATKAHQRGNQKEP